jgi:hypothetical protein
MNGKGDTFQKMPDGARVVRYYDEVDLGVQKMTRR